MEWLENYPRRVIPCGAASIANEPLFPDKCTKIREVSFQTATTGSEVNFDHRRSEARRRARSSIRRDVHWLKMVIADWHPVPHHW